MTTKTPWWIADLEDVCVRFQVDLSCLVDGEIDDVSAVRAIAHLESCEACRGFFEDARDQVRAHRELANPDALIERYSTLVGAAAGAEVEAIELIARLTSIFYQLGKAYVLTALDPDYHVRVFEKAVPVAELQVEGRGFVDGVLQRGHARTGGIDWARARHMLNGKLAKIENPLEKGRRLLQEAVQADPGHEEAQLYLAYLEAREGKTLRAAQSYRRIFRTAVNEANRAHSAVQLGLIWAEQREFQKAIACCRWVIASGLADREERFFFVRFNLGVYHANRKDRRRSLRAFRELLDKHPDRLAEVADFFARAKSTQAVIDLQPGFLEELVATCPELFDPGHGNESRDDLEDAS